MNSLKSLKKIGSLGSRQTLNPTPCLVAGNPKGPCTQIVDTLALKSSLFEYFGAKAYATWAHGPLG